MYYYYGVRCITSLSCGVIVRCCFRRIRSTVFFYILIGESISFLLN